MITGYEPAMPCQSSLHGKPHEGLTKREMFAAMAMQGMLSNRNITDLILRCVNKGQKSKVLAQAAIEQADALIAELNNNVNT
jgi:hypothetical protein